MPVHDLVIAKTRGSIVSIRERTTVVREDLSTHRNDFITHWDPDVIASEKKRPNRLVFSGAAGRNASIVKVWQDTGQR